MPNRLAFERSPYLRQHMENPVDWYPWGDEAFAKARSEHKPILLSIGYAACHWCHVMAHESFEDAGTAALMNAAFVNVKVDREERPDVDALYMRAVQALTRHGGWPMTVFLTPDGAPFFGGTYFPPDDRHGLPAFRRVLAGIAEAWRTRRDEVTRSADSLRRIYDESPTPPPPDAIDASVLADAARQAVAQYDAQHGGFGGAPKFPPTMTLDFLLRRWARTGDEALLEVVRHTWDRMARGGVFDQVGGGFHRYTVDGEWLVPHFEKMLYDNALLVRLGAHLWQATGDAEVRATTETTLDWLAREMTSPDGGFYASLDADSEGHEGRFYVWTMSELEQALGDEAPLLSAYWGASAGGNFEGRNILWRPTTNETFALRHGLSTSELARRVTAGRERLFASRTSRVRPARDEKIIAGWNGLMLRGVAEAARIFDDSRWRRLAVRAAEFLAAKMVHNGRALRVHGSDAATLPGVLEDHAALGLGFLAVHSLTFDARWLKIARQLATACERHFWDDGLGAFLDTADDAPPLIARLHDPFDNALPSGASLAVELQLGLAALDGDGLGAARARRALAAQADLMRRAPLGFGHLLGVADAEVDGAVSVVLAGTPGADDFTALARAIAALYVPSLVLTGGASADAGIAEGKHPRDGHATAYVCRGFSCDAPTTSADELARQLGDAVWR
ncbi:MAG: thioredoxin domain-containing protein [Gemmatimonadaceae bacterium]|nr:thioredoxin domain-containing protein [Gemmatimonadaceae bacterium]